MKIDDPVEAAIKAACASYEDKVSKEASNKGRRTIAYKKLAEHYGIDKFDLQNLMILNRGL